MTPRLRLCVLLALAACHHDAPEMRQTISRDDLTAFVHGVGTELGPETAVTDEHVESASGARVYVRTARLAYIGNPVELSFAFTAGAQVGGMQLKPIGPPALAPTTRGDYQTQTALHVPFTGAWTVVWGGRTLDDNYHASTHDQRFAYDILVVKDGVTHAGDGTKNSDYYAYGRPIVAPAAGTVVVAQDGVVENVPGQMDPRHAAGNYAVLDHGDGEFSFLAHMIPGSLAVHVGDHVAAGQAIGRCGNSGNSSEPHLHYHLQTTPRFHDGEGLPRSSSTTPPTGPRSRAASRCAARRSTSTSTTSRRSR